MRICMTEHGNTCAHYCGYVYELLNVLTSLVHIPLHTQLRGLRGFSSGVGPNAAPASRSVEVFNPHFRRTPSAVTAVFPNLPRPTAVPAPPEGPTPAGAVPVLGGRTPDATQASGRFAPGTIPRPRELVAALDEYVVGQAPAKIGRAHV